MRMMTWQYAQTQVNRSTATAAGQLAQAQRLKQASCWLCFLIPLMVCISILAQTVHERHVARQATEQAEAITNQLQLENQQLREEIEALRHNPATIERVAREELNMIRPNELIVSFPAGRLAPEAQATGFRATP
ncbi:MAG: septum formation initiator family protein [Acidobacteriota bacterium]|nr:septum formation initiator family protein [Acidobacteriota bacterium]